VRNEKAARRKALAARPLAPGDKVRVKKSVAEPRYGWGPLTHASVAIVIQLHQDSGGYVTVNPVASSHNAYTPAAAHGSNGHGAGAGSHAILSDELERVPYDDSDDDADSDMAAGLRAKLVKGKAGKSSKEADKAGKDMRGAAGSKDTEQSKQENIFFSASSVVMPPAELQADFVHFCARLLVARVSAGRSRGRNHERLLFDRLKINARAQYASSSYRFN
jgi:hypothetical protein